MLLNVLRCQPMYQGQAETDAEARFNIALRPRKPEGSSGRTAQDGHLDSHAAPELWRKSTTGVFFIPRLIVGARGGHGPAVTTQGPGIIRHLLLLLLLLVAVYLLGFAFSVLASWSCL